MSTATLTDMDQELRELLNEEKQANKYLHYITLSSDRLEGTKETSCSFFNNL